MALTSNCFGSLPQSAATAENIGRGGWSCTEHICFVLLSIPTPRIKIKTTPMCSVHDHLTNAFYSGMMKKRHCVLKPNPSLCFFFCKGVQSSGSSSFVVSLVVSLVVSSSSAKATFAKKRKRKYLQQLCSKTRFRQFPVQKAPTQTHQKAKTAKQNFTQKPKAKTSQKLQRCTVFRKLLLSSSPCS